MKEFLAKNKVHFVALALFIILSFTYFSPILTGKVLIGHDTFGWFGMSKESADYNDTHDDVALWTNSMFGGMPTYQINLSQPYNGLNVIEWVLKVFPRPVYFLFLYLIGFYLLLIMLRVNPWLSMAGAIAFAFGSYNLIIIAAGHNTKAIAIAYMAPLIGSILFAFRGKRSIGVLLTALFLGLAIKANHVQILYYTLFIVLIFGLSELLFAIKEKKLAPFFKTLGLLIVSAAIAIGINATNLLTTYEYSKYTMRGESNQLTIDSQSSQHGLNIEYITQWSYGVGETMTLLIPNFRGGASQSTLDRNSHSGKKLKEFGLDDSSIEKVLGDYYQFKYTYWGTQPMTSGPVYIGAIICFLFLLGLFLVEGKNKWWLLVATILSIILAWGKNFMPVTHFFVDYIPLYNKFRAVSMTLVIAAVSMTLMAFLGLKAFLSENADKTKNLRALLWSTAIVGGICLLYALIPSLAGNFKSPMDSELFTSDFSFLQETMPLDRKALLQADALRSLILILLAAGILWVKTIKKVSIKYIYPALIILFLADVYPIGKRYLNDANFTNKPIGKNIIRPTAADNFILQDKTYFRVLNSTKDIFNDSETSYFHKSIGGYHAAKLRRYQELINLHLSQEISRLFKNLQTAESQEDLGKAFSEAQVLNMLNVKYLIYSSDQQPLENNFANGNAWFVQEYKIAKDANEEMIILGKINTKKELVVDKEFASLLPDKIILDSTAKIILTNYSPNKLTYNYKTENEQIAVFSDIYYDKGWTAYVDGKVSPYFRANYLLRAMTLPAGEHQLEFKFEPKSYTIGNKIELISSIILFMAIGFVLFTEIKKRRKRVKE
jgi:hypothetical protein